VTAARAGLDPDAVPTEVAASRTTLGRR
jgi:hypothetical protein